MQQPDPIQPFELRISCYRPADSRPAFSYSFGCTGLESFLQSDHREVIGAVVPITFSSSEQSRSAFGR